MQSLRGIIVLYLLAVLAIGIAAPATARADEVIRAISEEVKPSFPDQITFDLEVESSAADISEAQLLYGATRAEAMTIVDLELTPRRRVDLSHVLDTQVYYFPPGTDISYHWVVRDAAGNELSTPVQQFVYEDQRFAWQDQTTGNVTVYWYEGGEKFGDLLKSTAESAVARMQAQMGAELTKPVRIYIYADREDMRSAMSSNSAEWIGGEANSQTGIIIGMIDPNGSGGLDPADEVHRLVPHELSHQLLHQATDNAYGGMPLWFNEGLAVHNQDLRDQGWDEVVQDAARKGRLIPLESLASEFPSDPDQAILSYAQSRDIVEYLINTYGEAKLQGLIQAFAAATPLEQALKETIGRGVDELDADWRATLPPADQVIAPTSEPQSAPPERFNEPPVVPTGQASGVPSIQIPDIPDRPAWLRWIESRPAWVTLGGTAFCCISLTIIVAAILLVVLRLTGVDKRTN